MHFLTILTLLALPIVALAAPAQKRANENDFLVLQFARVLELLETQFYTDALQKFQAADFIAAGFPNAEIAVQQFQGILQHETAHIGALETALVAFGQTPLQGCTFDFTSVLGDVATMAATARAVEHIGVSAYLGGAQLLTDINVLAAAGSIVTIEARHASILNVLNAGNAVPQAFDVALAPEQVLALAGGFVGGCNLGIPSNQPLTVTSTGPVVAGAQLTFASPGIDQAVAAAQTLSCQMLVGGAPAAISLPIEQCIVPPNIVGPVYISITNTSQPLQSSLKNQFRASIVAGPTLAFIEGAPEALSQLARGGAQAAPPAAPAPAPVPEPAPPVAAGTSTTVTTITPEQASSVLGTPQPTGAPVAPVAAPANVASVRGGPIVNVRRRRRSIQRRRLPTHIDAEVY